MIFRTKFSSCFRISRSTMRERKNTRSIANGVIRGLNLGESLETRAMLAVGTGDFNSDGELTVADIELLSTEVRRGTHTAAYDLDGNQLVNADDRRVWVENVAGTYFGDANLDRRFDSSQERREQMVHQACRRT